MKGPDSLSRLEVVSTIRKARRSCDLAKKDASPSILDLGPVRFKLARHFGFCFGVENATRIAFKALEENPERRVFLLSDMIHNPAVNADLAARGIRFLQRPDGSQLVPFESLTKGDVVIIPAFGTAPSILEELSRRGASLYNATCPFVEKVWVRAAELGEKGYSIIIHGKRNHEETRATFAHAAASGASLVLKDIEEAAKLEKYVMGTAGEGLFFREFEGAYSPGFRPSEHLARIGIVNQTTMLAGDTLALSSFLRDLMRRRYREAQLDEHFADTRETLCYATSENQKAVHALIESGGDVAIVVGGYSSSNTSHLARLCHSRLPTYHIENAAGIEGRNVIRHKDLEGDLIIETPNWLPRGKDQIDLLITAGASSPDSVVDQCLFRVADIFGVLDRVEAAVDSYISTISKVKFL